MVHLVSRNIDLDSVYLVGMYVYLEHSYMYGIDIQYVNPHIHE